MPLQFGRGAFIKLGEESTYGTIAGAMGVDNRIISASFQNHCCWSLGAFSRHHSPTHAIRWHRSQQDMSHAMVGPRYDEEKQGFAERTRKSWSPQKKCEERKM